MRFIYNIMISSLFSVFAVSFVNAANIEKLVPAPSLDARAKPLESPLFEKELASNKAEVTNPCSPFDPRCQ